MNCDICCPPQHSQRRNQPYQPKTMISMQMTNKYMVQSSSMHTILSHPNLRPLATIYHKLLIPHFQHLRRMKGITSWQRRTRTQYSQFQFTHNIDTK